MNEIRAEYEVLSSKPLPSMRGEALQLRHTSSGARILHIKCLENENCFCVAVPTPPPDDTGMPHILEHMTLAGSSKFPCKEPFFEMIKRSVATFINALTGNDITYYPVCSTVKTDLFNLADVYFDAVFHPLLSPETFAREAYHLAPADPANPTGELRCDGIVYSEMKGVFSSPEGILERDFIRQLLPDTCHGKESGGNPENIPELTLETLRAFHAKRYNPSNAFIILFGDIPTEDWLDFLAPRLVGFAPQPALPPIARQPRWTEPRSLISRYPLPQSEDKSGKTYLALNWLVGDSTDLDFSARLSILNYLLTGNDAAPLSKAIEDSHIGANLIMDSAMPNGLEETFHLVLDGSEPDRMPQFRKVVFDTLEELSRKPFPAEDVEAAFQQTVYACNEIGSKYAFTTVMSAATACCAGLDPSSLLEKAPFFEKVRRDIEADPMLLPNMIKPLFLDNPHRLDIVMAPSGEMEAERDAATSKRLAEIRASMTDAQARAIADAAVSLEAANAAPSSPEALACLPQLHASDMPEVPPQPEYDVRPLSSGAQLLVARNIATNGIVYLALSFDISDLPRHLVPFIQPFCDAIDDFGAAGLDYVAAAKKRARCSGMFGARHAFYSLYGKNGEFSQHIYFNLKTTVSSLDAALDALREAVFEVDPRDRSRMADILLQQRTLLRSEMVQDARTTTRRRAARFLSEFYGRTYEISGIPQLRLFERLAGADSATAYNECTRSIEEIRNWILGTHRMTASLVAPREVEDRIAAALNSFMAAMPPPPKFIEPYPVFATDLSPRCEGLSAALQVSFAALFTPAPFTHEPEAAALMPGASIVSSDYMLPEIRLKGNAYGAGLAYNSHSGSLCFSTYRDPHIAESYSTMLRAADFAKSKIWSDETVENAILAVLKGFVAPIRPADALLYIIMQHISGFNNEASMALYRKILSLKRSQVQDVTVATLEKNLAHASYCVAASEAALIAANIPDMSIETII